MLVAEVEVHLSKIPNLRSNFEQPFGFSLPLPAMPVPSPPTRPALRAKFEARRREVVATAAKLFAERGYDATSMSELTQATGLAAGGLYHYIEGKDDLLIAICDELLEPLLTQAREIVAAEAPPVEQLRELVRAWVAHVVSHRHHMLVFTQERQTIERQQRWRRVRSQRRAFERILDEVLARGEADGSMRFADRRLSLLALLGMVNYTPQWVRPQGRLSAAEIADGYCAMVLS
jgi:TetR/AcrR family transcriptional regulator, cholesterol catabolism regulator